MHESMQQVDWYISQYRNVLTLHAEDYAICMLLTSAPEATPASLRYGTLKYLV